MSLGFPVKVWWDYDEEDLPSDLPEIVILPAELCHNKNNPIDLDDVDEEILDWVSDEYGYCVYSLEFL